MHKGVDRVPECDGEGIRAEAEIALPGAIRSAGQDAACLHRHVHRQHLADVPVLHQLAQVHERRRRAPLQADHGA
jgi:hypothetical protein